MAIQLNKRKSLQAHFFNVCVWLCVCLSICFRFVVEHECEYRLIVFKLKCWSRTLAMVCVGLWMSPGTYSTGSPANIGTYNLTSFLKFQMSKKQEEKETENSTENQWTEANLVISYLLHLTPKPNGKMKGGYRPPFSFASIDFIVFAYISFAIHLPLCLMLSGFSVNRFPFAGKIFSVNSIFVLETYQWLVSFQLLSFSLSFSHSLLLSRIQFDSS